MKIFSDLQRNEVIIVELEQSRFDASQAIRFKQEVVGLIRQGTDRLVVNLHNVDFMDSSGVGSLLTIMKAIGGNDRIAICNANEGVDDVFRQTHMNHIFAMHRSVADAVRHVSA